MKNVLNKKALPFALASLMLSGAAWAVPTPGPVTWGSLPLYADGNLSGNFDFGGAGQVDFTITNLGSSTLSRSTAATGHDFESHAAFPATSGEAVTLTSSNSRGPANVTFDFSNYTGLEDSLVLGLGHIAGNLSGFGGSDVEFNQALTMLSDLNGVGNLSADGLNLDVTGNATGDGDFVLGGFILGNQLTINFDMAARDGLRFAIGQVPALASSAAPIPAPASILLLLSGAALIRRRHQRKAS